MAGVPGIHYQQNIKQEFHAELQGARIKRLLNMKPSKISKWTSKTIAKIIDKEDSVVRRKLLDQYGWTKKEIELIAEAANISFDRLYVYDNRVRLRASRGQKPVRLFQVTTDPKLLNYFLGVQLDSRSRDAVVKHLAKLEKWIGSNKEKIRKKRVKERARNQKREMLRFILRTLHEETGVWPFELVRMKKIHGNYLHFQERFDELKLAFKPTKQDA